MNPVLFETQYFAINTLWLFIAAGVIIGVYTLIILAERNSLKLQFLSENSAQLLLWTLIGARIFGIIENYQAYFYEFSIHTILNIFYIWDKGLNFGGAAVAFLIYFFIICKKNDQDFFKWLDTLIPASLIAIAFGNIGTFFDGSNYGHETSMPWGVNFESPSIKYTVPIHPTQIYAFIYTSLIAAGLILTNRIEKISKLERTGFIGLLGITAYNFFRFLEEFLRGDDAIMILGIRLPQLIAILIAISSGIFLYLRYNSTITKKIINKFKKVWKK
ncbi:MAG: prolipoprotein diacylglyceryl transferase [Candidatus Peregrinibacteria bacterium]|nr:prolipoprotein diacylglyceryl transferase [Candidatus Peregrinibacteria bacterium]